MLHHCGMKEVLMRGAHFAMEERIVVKGFFGRGERANFTLERGLGTWYWFGRVFGRLLGN